MYRYLLIQSKHPFFRKTVYGIRAEKYQNGGWKTVAVAPDVSCDRAIVIGLARRCNKHKLSPIHLMDAVMDVITDPVG